MPIYKTLFYRDAAGWLTHSPNGIDQLAIMSNELFEHELTEAGRCEKAFKDAITSEPVGDDMPSPGSLHDLWITARIVVILMKAIRLGKWEKRQQGDSMEFRFSHKNLPEPHTLFIKVGDVDVSEARNPTEAIALVRAASRRG